MDEDHVEYLVEVNKRILDKRLAHVKEIFALGQGYNQVLIGLGFAAFLTIWAKAAPSLPRADVLLTGGLLAVSLCVFVAFHLTVMVIRSLVSMALGKKLIKGDLDAEGVIGAFAENDMAQIRATGWILRLWPVIFGVSTATGLGGAGYLAVRMFWSSVYSATP
ncbi:hypothetical protein BH10PSE4_BH10PSE4_23590 [soil metagenome]